MTLDTLAEEVAGFPHGRVPKDVRRRHVMAIAEELFAERGYAGASMDELAERAGVSKPVVYGLVGSKEELYRAVVQRAADELAERVEAAVRSADDPEAQLRAGALAFFTFIAERRLAWDVLFLAEPGGRFAAEAQAIRTRQASVVATLLAEGAERLGAKVDRRRIEAGAHGLNGAFEGISHWWLANPAVPAEALADWVVALMLPGLVDTALHGLAQRETAR